MPSAVIGAIRTRLGRLTDYDEETVKRLRKIEQCGPFLAAKTQGLYTLAFPAPADAVAFEAKTETRRLAFAAGETCGRRGHGYARRAASCPDGPYRA